MKSSRARPEVADVLDLDLQRVLKPHRVGQIPAVHAVAALAVGQIAAIGAGKGRAESPAGTILVLGPRRVDHRPAVELEDVTPFAPPAGILRIHLEEIAQVVPAPFRLQDRVPGIDVVLSAGLRRPRLNGRASPRRRAPDCSSATCSASGFSRRHIAGPARSRCHRPGSRGSPGRCRWPARTAPAWKTASAGNTCSSDARSPWAASSSRSSCPPGAEKIGQRRLHAGFRLVVPEDPQRQVARPA